MAKSGQPEHLGYDQIEALYEEVRVADQAISANANKSHGIRAALAVLKLVTGRVDVISVSTTTKNLAMGDWYHDFGDNYAKRVAAVHQPEVVARRPRMAGLLRG